MSGTTLEYDPIKFRLAKLLGRNARPRRLFHLALDWLFLRAWYVRWELKRLKFTSGFHPKLILDAGMGFGQYSDRMMRLFPDARLVGFEIDPDYFYGGVTYFRTTHPSVRFLVGDVQRLPIADDRFDLILCVDVMEHVEDDRSTFAEYHRILRQGGYFMMHTPPVQDDGEMHEGEHFNPETCQVGEHVRDGYRIKEARERMEDAGFRIVRVVRGYGRMGMIAWKLLQGVPMRLLAVSKLLIPFVAIYLIIAYPLAFAAMCLDLAGGDHPRGGSLVVVAQK